jgi:hypothetical protein
MSLLQRLALLFLFTATVSSAQQYDEIPAQTQRTFYHVKGPVQNLKEQKWIPSADSTVFAATTIVNVDNSYKLEQALVLDFNENGYLTKQVSSETEGKKKNKMKEQSRLFYYRGNKLIGLINTEDNKRVDSVEFHYRKKGQMDYYRLFNTRGNNIAEVDFTYKNGKVFSVRKKNEEHLPVSTVKYIYKDGKIVETQHFNGQSYRFETRKYSNHIVDGKINDSYSVLDDKGNLKEGLLLVKDSTGRLLERNVISDERKVMEYNGYQYNTNGDIETEKLFNAAVELTIINRYTYDDHSNWTKKEIFYNGILNAVVTREIKYY